MNNVYESWMLIMMLAVLMGMLGAYHSHHSPNANVHRCRKKNDSTEEDL